MKTTVLWIIATLGLIASLPRADAQGSTFTYQGRLNDGGTPANGLYDLRFTIYDSTNNPGVVVAGPLTNSAAGVSNGLFTVALDFGAGVFTGRQMGGVLLERVRAGGGLPHTLPRAGRKNSGFERRRLRPGVAAQRRRALLPAKSWT